MYNFVKPVYSDQELPQEVSRTLFLCGPSPRNSIGENWREKALKYLDSIKYDGHVFIPLTSDGTTPSSYDDQRQWEINAIDRADCIVFWVPRDMKTLPGLTTNIEFGLYVKSGRIVLGYPTTADKMTYLHDTALENGVPVFNTLEETLQAAINKIGEGALRSNGNELVPLMIYKTKEFQDWIKKHNDIGNYLTYFKTSNVFIIPKSSLLLYWFANVEVFIKQENRVKREFIQTRKDTCSCVIHTQDMQIIVVKEARNTARNEVQYSYDLPGGGGDSSKTKIQTIIDEVLEETGIQLEADRVKHICDKQVTSTFSLHYNSLFEYIITDEELQTIKSNIEGKTFGVTHDTEITYVEVIDYKDLLELENIDWLLLGEIALIADKS